ncbi:sulfite exporter TauE/SafE family protein [Pseudodonghicola flavimaris]|uniref:Probable membrane transporter protein n=1 Tax=Pseudodonghicola flavimaris TaxID=3050036 RepID=A0ABT7F739_9RHOB|nr:sulfite exporter TauE/SafE family protein [Pseudodonghicola flavimaris]MDK3020219.1 sulfite exporter TauE/SafE family protein [Pseudodonghicola flavimaris]
MDMIFSLMSPSQMIIAFAIALVAGLIKGMVGFALPLILISGISTFLPPEVALAGLILPTVATNVIQALRQGPAAALGSIRRFRVFLIVGGLFLMASAQMVSIIPVQVMLLVLGALITVFCLMQLVGVKFHMSEPSTRVEALVAALAGAVGGVSGVWGPPTVAYLTAIGTPKLEQVRVQGVIYGLGAVALLAAHLGSGVLNRATLPFSVALLVPVLLGMWLGGRVHDRIEQETFRKLTLAILLLAGLNLIRRALMG